MNSELIEISRKFFKEIREFTTLLDQVFASELTPGRENIKLNRAVYDNGDIECKHYAEDIFLEDNEYKHTYTVKVKGGIADMVIQLSGNKTCMTISVTHHINRVYIELLHSDSLNVYRDASYYRDLTSFISLAQVICNINHDNMKVLHGDKMLIIKEILDVIYKVSEVIHEVELYPLVYSEENYENSIDEDLIINI